MGLQSRRLAVPAGCSRSNAAWAPSFRQALLRPHTAEKSPLRRWALALGHPLESDSSLTVRKLLGLHFSALESRLCWSQPNLFCSSAGLFWVATFTCWLQQQWVSGWYWWPRGTQDSAPTVGKGHFWWDRNSSLWAWGAFCPSAEGWNRDLQRPLPA